MRTKFCTKCCKEKPLTSEHWYRKKGERWFAWCRPCTREHQLAYRAEACVDCGKRASQGSKRCRRCFDAFRRAGQVSRLPKKGPRCVRCGELPQRRGDLCVLCDPGLPVPPIEFFADERRGDQA